MTAETSDKNNSLGQRIIAEIHEYAIICLYLWVCFVVVTLYKTAVLRAEHFQFLPMGVAAVKALILGKFILIGKALKVDSMVKPERLLPKIVWKSLVMLALLIVFTVIEEFVVGMVHGHSLASTASELLARPLVESVAPSLVMLLVLIPLISVEEFNQALGKGTLRRLLLGRPGAGKED